MAINPRIYDLAVIDAVEAILREDLQDTINIYGLEYDRAGVTRVFTREIAHRLDTPLEAADTPTEWTGVWIRITQSYDKPLVAGVADAFHRLELWLFAIGQDGHPDDMRSHPVNVRKLYQMARAAQNLIEGKLCCAEESVQWVKRLPANRTPIQPVKKAPWARVLVDTYEVKQRVFSAIGSCGDGI